MPVPGDMLDEEIAPRTVDDATLAEAFAALWWRRRSIGKQKEAEYMLDSYSRMVERQTRALEQEKERVEKLLLNIMPRRVYEELKDFGTTTPQSFDDGVRAHARLRRLHGDGRLARPGALIAELNDIFTSFDRIVEHFRCERIKTIGDAYMAVAGVPEPDPDHDAQPRARGAAHAQLPRAPQQRLTPRTAGSAGSASAAAR
jgi:hypothetical protein